MHTCRQVRHNVEGGCERLTAQKLRILFILLELARKSRHRNKSPLLLRTFASACVCTHADRCDTMWKAGASSKSESLNECRRPPHCGALLNHTKGNGNPMNHVHTERTKQALNSCRNTHSTPIQNTYWHHQFVILIWNTRNSYCPFPYIYLKIYDRRF